MMVNKVNALNYFWSILYKNHFWIPIPSWNLSLRVKEKPDSLFTHHVCFLVNKSTLSLFTAIQFWFPQRFNLINKSRYLRSDGSRGGSRPLPLSITRQTVTVVGLAVKLPCRTKKTDSTEITSLMHVLIDGEQRQQSSPSGVHGLYLFCSADCVFVIQNKKLSLCVSAQTSSGFESHG